MNKFWKQTMALFLAFALVFGTLVPVVAWAEEPANIEAPTVESKPEAPAEKETQAEPEKKLTEEETEGKETEENEELELSKENTPDAQGEPANTEKPFTVTKRAFDNESDSEVNVGKYDTFHDAVEACKQDDLKNIYIVTMNSDYTISETEDILGKTNVNILLRSVGNPAHTLSTEQEYNMISFYGGSTFETQNVVFDGKEKSQFVTSNDSTLTLGAGTVVQNFVDVKNQDGPAISLTGNSILNIKEEVIIQNNSSQLEDGKTSGVIELNQDCTLNIEGGTFENNTSNYFGGVILSFGTVNISDGIFKGNSATDGGVIGSFGKGALNITGGKFEDNTATDTGGAIRTKVKSNIEGATFRNNSAKKGGAIYSQGVATVTDSTFSSNEAKNQGGAIYQRTGQSDITNSIFEENFANKGGGAIYINFDLSEQQTTIKQSTFKKNAAVFGGGVYLGGNSKLNVTETKFTENEAAYGGGIATPSKYAQMDKEKSNLSLEQTTFTSNKALEGGGIFTSVPTEIAQSSFMENNAIVHKDDVQENPHVSGTGGAIYVADQKTTVKNSTFEKNNAGGSGGAIGVNGVTRDDQGQITDVKSDAKLEITDGTSFKSNMAKVGQGGAIYVIPYAYTDPIKSDDEKLKNELYQKLTTDSTTIFEGNTSGSGYYTPPENYEDFNHLAFEKNSFTDKPVVDEKLHKSLLNNYDVNYKNPNVTVLYDANGGAFAGGEKTKSEKHTINTGEGQDSKVEIIILSETPTRTGYTFVGWKGEDGKTYKAGEKLTIYGNRLFTAIWEETTSTPSRDERIIVDPNGGTFSDGTTGRKTYDLKAGETFVLPAEPTREGYKFIAWEGKSGTYQPGDKYTVKSGGDVFTARWEEEKKPEEKPSVKPNIKTPKGTPLTPDEIAKILAGMKKTVPAIPRAGVGK